MLAEFGGLFRVAESVCGGRDGVAHDFGVVGRDGCEIIFVFLLNVARRLGVGFCDLGGKPDEDAQKRHHNAKRCQNAADHKVVGLEVAKAFDGQHQACDNRRDTENADDFEYK